MRQTVTATGKLLRFLSPAPRARREVLLRNVFEEQVAAGMRKRGTSENRSAALLGQGPLKLSPLEVVELTVEDAAVRGLELEGDAVLAYWTVPHGQTSTLFLQGRKSGHAVVRALLPGGGSRLFPIDVP